jgi:tRNA dimethylallyltransferase
MSVNNENKKIIVILGPTASGKSDLAVKVAKYISKNWPRIFKKNLTSVKNNSKAISAEIISADSRQVYKGMDLGTGKVPRDKQNKTKNDSNVYFYRGVSHHLIDIVSPKQQFSVANYVKRAQKVIKKLFKENKIPIICGGSAFYIKALVDGLNIPNVKPDYKLRKELEKKSTEELFKMIKKLDPQRAKTIDKNNKRRLIRAIEIVTKTKEKVPKLKFSPLPYPVLFLGVKIDKNTLKERIRKRLLKRLKAGMVKEVENLKKSGLSWKRIESFGLEYKWIAYYLQGKINYQEMIEKLQKDIEHFAKRQMTWWKKDKRIHWIQNFKEAQKLIEDFLKN